MNLVQTVQGKGDRVECRDGAPLSSQISDDVEA